MSNLGLICNLMSRLMLRSASAALLMAVTLALPMGLARAASYDDGLMPPGTVGQDQASQDLASQDQASQDQALQDQPYPDQPSPQQPMQGGYGDNQATDDQAPVQQPQGGYVVAQDSTMGDLLVRVQRLEGDNRRLNGTIDDLQAQVRKLQDDIKRQQDDTEYRLQALEGGGGKGPAPKPAPVAPLKPKSGQNGLGTPPKTLGSIPSDDSNEVATQDQPVDDADAGPAPAPRPPRQMNSSTIAPGLPGVAVDTSRPLASNAPDAGMDAAPATPATPEDEYTADYRLIETQRYDQAETAFRSFVTNHPKDKRVPDAIHWIGESLYQRKQYTDAAEQFLKVTKTYGTSRRAPSSMLKLGMTLAAMGEKDAACAALQAVASKYPKAGPTILSGADREIKKNACTAG